MSSLCPLPADVPPSILQIFEVGIAGWWGCTLLLLVGGFVYEEAHDLWVDATLWRVDRQRTQARKNE